MLDVLCPLRDDLAGYSDDDLGADPVKHVQVLLAALRVVATQCLGER